MRRDDQASCAYAHPFIKKSSQNPFLTTSPSTISLELPSYLSNNFQRCTTDKSFAFAFDIAHRDVLGIKADAISARSFGGNEGIGAFRIVPSLVCRFSSVVGRY